MCLAILLVSLIQCVYVICDNNNNTVMNVTSNADFSLENGWEIDAIDSLEWINELSLIPFIIIIIVVIYRKWKNIRDRDNVGGVV